MRPVDPLRAIYEWIEQLKEELPLSLVIRNVSARMRKSEGEEERFLASQLESLLTRAERDQEALALIEEMIARYPDDVRFPIRKASLYFYYLEDPEEALRAIDAALERAHRTKFFLREALGVKARILLQLLQGEELSDVLEEIMSVRVGKDVPDIGRERDFVDQAPPGLIRANVLARYNEFRPKRAGDSTANEPPEWEHPDDEE